MISPEDPNGNVVLSYVRAREEKDWEEAEGLLSEGQAFDSSIIGYNKGGLLVPLGKLRGFVPASQISLVRRAAAGDRASFAALVDRHAPRVARLAQRLLEAQRLRGLGVEKMGPIQRVQVYSKVAVPLKYAAMRITQTNMGANTPASVPKYLARM